MPRTSRDIADLIAIMAALRTPGTGCPWDLAQDFASIAPYTIEEAAEVADAIARGDMLDLRDELGDLLLQVVYHARMAEERQAFAFGDVVEAITAKMIRRHPHVFGTPQERASGAAPGFWERIKAGERAAKATERRASAGTQVAAESVLDGVPAALPALSRAVKLQDKAARVGFDWPSLVPVLAKVREEIAELETAVAAPAPDHAHVAEEIGDLLFVIANVARHLKVEPEAALRATNEKFRRRFAHIEERLAAGGRTPNDSSLEEMDALWDEAKLAERAPPDPTNE
ncbi:MAG: nucleoside triphosphate pyrophosphohydrolase [Hyphomicrobiaceae bacterium]